MFGNLFEKLKHLPVVTIADKVADYFGSQMIPIVTSEVASGKTMLIPAACAMRLADDPVDSVVYVLEPTRFLANNAAESLRSLLGREGESLIGCINSNRSDDESILHPNNRIIFTTVGYALSSGLLKSRHNFILDEAHETSIDLSLVKAYLHHRLEQGDNINVAIMSATIDIANELTYWGDDATQFSTPGSAYPVEILHRPADPLEECVLDLIQAHDRKGILVFVSGVEEIENAVEMISNRLDFHQIDYEIASVHGNSSGDERRLASSLPKATIKVTVGTNVLESGISLPWVDAGVSSGDTKVMHAKGNVRRLVKEDLPRWRIHQQAGRVGRFGPGVFILAHTKPLEHRPDMAQPDIVRLPLTELVMHCTNFPDIHIHDLKFSPSEQPVPSEVDRAIASLVDYGLVEEKDGRVVLTREGQLIRPLPVSYRAAAAICEAHKINKLAEMLPLIVAMDIGDLRHDYRTPMGGAVWDTSDLVQQTMTIARYLVYNTRDLTRRDMMYIGEEHNISLKKYNEFMLLLRDLEKKTQCRAKWSAYLDSTDTSAREHFDFLTKWIIFRGMSQETYPFRSILRSVRIPTTEQSGQIFISAETSSTTRCNIDFDSEIIMIAGGVRIVTPKRRRPFAVLESMTTFTRADVRRLVKTFGKIPFQRILDLDDRGLKVDDLLVDDHVVRTRPATPSVVPDISSILKAGYGMSSSPKDEVVTKKALEKVKGTFGDLLTAALDAKK